MFDGHITEASCHIYDLRKQVGTSLKINFRNMILRLLTRGTVAFSAVGTKCVSKEGYNLLNFLTFAFK